MSPHPHFECLAKDFSNEAAQNKAIGDLAKTGDKPHWKTTRQGLQGGPINVAKFLYWKETRKFKAKRGFEDTYLIEALRARRAAFDQQLRDSKATVIAREKRMMT